MAEYYGIEYLRRKLNKKRVRVRIRYDHYEMKNRKLKQSAVIPYWLKDLYGSTCGWCAKAVDALSDRLVFEGFTPETDAYGTQPIFNANNPDIFFDSLIRESQIAACAFVQVAHGENPGDLPRLSVLTADDATGIIDEFTGLLKEGYAVLDRNADGSPKLEAWFTPEFTEYYKKGEEPRREENPARYPLLIPVPYRPDAKRPFGHSRISRACMYYQEFARNTLERAEISAEFYSFPQKYVTGLSPDAEPLDAWRASISAMLRFDKDEDGDAPKLGQFTQQSMSPYTEQLRTAAAMFSGETGLTLDDLGFVTENPSSAEAIKAAHENLRLTARKAQRTYGTAFANVGFIAASVRDEYPYNRDLVAQMRAEWLPVFEPDAAMLSNVGDGAIKLNQAVPGYFTRENLKTLTGIEPDEAISIVPAETDEVVNE